MVKTTYSAVQVAAPGKLEPVERVIPEPGPGQVRIRVEACGVGVSGWTIGQRVGVGFLGGYCTVCENCRRGDFTH